MQVISLCRILYQVKFHVLTQERKAEGNRGGSSGVWGDKDPDPWESITLNNGKEESNLGRTGKISDY